MSLLNLILLLMDRWLIGKIGGESSLCPEDEGLVLLCLILFVGGERVLWFGRRI